MPRATSSFLLLVAMPFDTSSTKKGGQRPFAPHVVHAQRPLGALSDPSRAPLPPSQHHSSLPEELHTSAAPESQRDKPSAEICHLVTAVRNSTGSKLDVANSHGLSTKCRLRSSRNQSLPFVATDLHPLSDWCLVENGGLTPTPKVSIGVIPSFPAKHQSAFWAQAPKCRPRSTSGRRSTSTGETVFASSISAVYFSSMATISSLWKLSRCLVKQQAARV